MAEFVYTPQPHQVFNEFDRLGLLLGLPRLEEERNGDYKHRLLDVFVHRASSTYQGLLNGVTRELGLSFYEALTITPVMSGDSTLGTNPAVVFQDTKCLVYSDLADTDSGLIATIDRFERYDGAYTIQELADAITDTGYFVATVNSNSNKRSMTIFNQSTVGLVTSEEVDRNGARIKLANSNLISNSIVLRSPNLVERVTTQAALRRAGQYYVDPVLGLLYSTEAPASGTVIRYKYRNDNYTAIATPVIIHNLQSDDFKTKMFEQITAEGTDQNGLPTELGADLINELLSVHPTAYGT